MSRSCAPLLDVSLPVPLCTSHSISTSSFFERITTLQSATWRTLWPNGWTEHFYMLWAERSHWNEQYLGYTDILPQIVLRALLLPSRIGFGRWTNKGYVGFTTVLTGERSKCRPTTSLSLQQKTLWQVHLTSEKLQGNLQRCSHTRL